MAAPCLALLLLLCLLEGTAHGHSSGAPSETCEDMTPHHEEIKSGTHRRRRHGSDTEYVSEQTTASPGSVQFSKDEISPNETIQVIITLTDSIEGIHLQARDETGHRVGTWTIPDSWKEKLQLMKCNDGTKYVTHRNAAVVNTTIQLTWTAPTRDELSGTTVTVFGTYVVKYDEFWVKVPSSVSIAISSVNPCTYVSHPQKKMSTNNKSFLYGDYGANFTVSTCQAMCNEMKECRSVEYRVDRGEHVCTLFNVTIQELQKTGRAGEIYKATHSIYTFTTYDRDCPVH